MIQIAPLVHNHVICSLEARPFFQSKRPIGQMGYVPNRRWVRRWGQTKFMGEDADFTPKLIGAMRTLKVTTEKIMMKQA